MWKSLILLKSILAAKLSYMSMSFAIEKGPVRDQRQHWSFRLQGNAG